MVGRTFGGLPGRPAIRDWRAPDPPPHLKTIAWIRKVKHRRRQI
jgi:hypothetical protein